MKSGSDRMASSDPRLPAAIPAESLPASDGRTRRGQSRRAPKRTSAVPCLPVTLMTGSMTAAGTQDGRDVGGVNAA